MHARIRLHWASISTLRRKVRVSMGVVIARLTVPNRFNARAHTTHTHTHTLTLWVIHLMLCPLRARLLDSSWFTWQAFIATPILGIRIYTRTALLAHKFSCFFFVHLHNKMLQRYKSRRVKSLWCGVALQRQRDVIFGWLGKLKETGNKKK